MFWVLKRTVSMRAPKTHAKTGGLDFILKNFVYLNMCKVNVYVNLLVFTRIAGTS